MAAELVTRAPDDLIERVVVGGDLTALTPAQRTQYYQGVCESLGLNPLTRPFEYIRLQGKLTLYARRDAADQLRRLHGISVVTLRCATPRRAWPWHRSALPPTAGGQTRAASARNAQRGIA